MTGTESSEARFDRLEARIAAQDAQIAAQAAEIRDLRARTSAQDADDGERRDRLEPPSVGPAAAPSSGGSNGGAVDRRSALKKGLGLAGAAATAAVVLEAAPAAAADGDPVILGTLNTSTETTHIQSSAAGSTALAATGPATGGGLTVSGGKHHLRCFRSNTRGQPPGDTVAHNAGEFVVDSSGNLWYCVGDGTPGTWRSLSGMGSSGAFYPYAAPRRAYDSRPGTVPSLGPKTKLNGTRTLNLRTAAGVDPLASAVLVNVLLVNATAGAGNFSIWMAGLAKPQANTLVWGGNAGRFSTLAFANIDATGNVNLNASLPTHVVIDVVGHYR